MAYPRYGDVIMHDEDSTKFCRELNALMAKYDMVLSPDLELLKKDINTCMMGRIEPKRLRDHLQ